MRILGKGSDILSDVLFFDVVLLDLCNRGILLLLVCLVKLGFKLG